MTTALTPNQDTDKSALWYAIEDAGGDLPAGVLLYRLRFWYRLATVQRDGHDWRAITRDGMCADTHLSLQQYKDALAKLKARGLIQTRQMIYGRRAVTHYRVVPVDPTEVESGGPTEVEPTDTAYIKGENKGENKGESGGASAPQSPAPEVCPIPENPFDPSEENLQLTATKKPDHASKLVPKTKAPYSVKDVLSKGKAASNPSTKPGTPASLEVAWKSAMGEAGYGFQQGWTMAEKGMSKTLAKRCTGSVTAESVIGYAAANWIDVVKTIAEQDGVSHPPLKPNLGFLIKHSETAIDYVTKKLAAPKKAALTVKAAAPIIEPAAPATPAAGKPKADKMTKEEFLAMMGGGNG